MPINVDRHVVGSAAPEADMDECIFRGRIRHGAFAAVRMPSDVRFVLRSARNLPNPTVVPSASVAPCPSSLSRPEPPRRPDTTNRDRPAAQRLLPRRAVNVRERHFIDICQTPIYRKEKAEA
jgi:hypothetical protein